MDSMEGKTVVITGASRGLGKALAIAFARAGTNLVLNSRSEESLEPVVTECEGLASRVLPVAGDVTESGTVQKLVGGARETFGGIDVFINNAGLLGPRVKIEEYPEDEWRAVIDANLTAPFALAKAAIPHLNEGASVINLVSGVSVEGRAEWGAYSVSKFGMEGLTQILAAELADRGVRVNAVDPGGMRTEMRAAAYPQEDPATKLTPEENVDVFLYLASDDSRDITGERFKAQEFARS